MREQDPSNSRTALSGTVHFAAGKKFALNKDQLTHAAAIFEEMSDLAGRKPVKIDVDAAWTELLRIRFEEDDSDEHFAFYSALGVVEFGENKACSLSESELLTVVEFFESVSDAAPTED